MNLRYLAILLVLATSSVVMGCRGGTSPEPPMLPFRGMHEMPRYDPQEESEYFADHRNMRMPVEGTLPMETETDVSTAHGVDDSGNYVMTVPAGVVTRAGGMQALLDRGHTRYDIYCSPCHSYTGDGNGMVSRRAIEIGTAFQAASLHDDRIRHLPDGQIYATIANGIRTMPAYRAQIPVQDRWAIVAYVRALQLSQENTRTASLNAPATEPAQ